MADNISCLLYTSDYKDFSAVENAVNAVARGKNITEQGEVDAMAKATEDAIAALQYKDCLLYTSGIRVSLFPCG